MLDSRFLYRLVSSHRILSIFTTNVLSLNYVQGHFFYTPGSAFPTAGEELLRACVKSTHLRICHSAFISPILMELFALVAFRRVYRYCLT